jgi:hypothetical protein
LIDKGDAALFEEKLGKHIPESFVWHDVHAGLRKQATRCTWSMTHKRVKMGNQEGLLFIHMKQVGSKDQAAEPQDLVVNKHPVSPSRKKKKKKKESKVGTEPVPTMGDAQQELRPSMTEVRVVQPH